MPYSDEAISVVRSGNVVAATGNVVFKQTGSFNYQTVNETFPQGYRPKSANSVIVAAKNNLAFLVQPSGAVSIDGTIGELYCELSGCWITDDPLP